MNRTDPQDGQSTKCILYVEDDIEILKAMETLISLLGYDVYATSTGSEAIELIKSDPVRFDLVITDYQMPGIDGLELARMVTSINPNIPIILGTGSIEVNEVKTKQFGITALLQKPFSIQDLENTIRKVLDNIQE